LVIADRVMLRGDPARDITALSNVAFTIHHGQILFGIP
jgi:hypothetical protein